MRIFCNLRILAPTAAAVMIGYGISAMAQTPEGRPHGDIAPRYSAPPAINPPRTAHDFTAGLIAYEKRDYATALAIWWPLAVHGDPRSQSSLGFMYYSGLGVTRDDGQSLDWFRKAADAGQATAQFFLGLHYLFGRGLPRDAAMAHAWCDIAMTYGHEDALYCREQAAASMKPGDALRSREFAARFHREHPQR